MRRGLLCLLAAATGLLGVGLPPEGPAAAAPPGDDTVIGFVVRGVGNGHGRGMSQWGAYGRALAGQTWEQILDAYYGGTTLVDQPSTNVRVRLTPWDNAATFGVISRPGGGRWSAANSGSGTAYLSLYATEVGTNVFDVYGSTSQYGCPGASEFTVPMVRLDIGSSGPDVLRLQELLNHFGHDPGPHDGVYGTRTADAVRAFQAAEGLAQTGVWDSPEWTHAQARLNEESQIGWSQVADNVAGPVVFTTSADETTSAPGDVLGGCRPTGAVQHYRGTLELHSTGDGNRVVNGVNVENYLRGVLPREVSASWGDAGGGSGMHALRAQAVAARSYGLTQERYGYAGTCDTPSCQVYGGAATRGSPGSGNNVSVERAQTDAAIRDTAGKVRTWPDGGLVSTEFSASNGPRTAGGSFPPVDDPFDDVPGNPLHEWTRVIDADAIAGEYGLGRADAVHTAHDPGSPFDGIWANEVALGNGASRSAWDFRNDFGLPAPGFELVPMRRETTSVLSFAWIGDSVGVGVAGDDAAPLRTVLEGVHVSQTFDSRAGRTTLEGAQVAATVPEGTDLVVVELGYNDTPSTMPARIDAVMGALRERRVGQVVWVTVSERRDSVDYGLTNAAIRGAQARWPELSVIDWNAASAGPAADRWYADDVHLTGTGNAEFALWLRNHILDSTAQPVDAGELYRVPVLGLGGVPGGATAGAAGVGGVALNVTAVGPSGPGYLAVWDCAAVEPDTSSVNWTTAGAIAPNAVLVPLAASGSGEVCLRPLVRTHVIVDVAGYFPAETGAGVLQGAAGRASDTRTSGRVAAGEMIRVPLLGVAGIPPGVDATAAGVTGAALNVTAVNPVAAGYLRVWDCAAPEPDTSSVNFTTPGTVEPNAVVVPLTGAGEVCVRSLFETDVIVDVAGWFSGGVRPAAGRVVDTRPTARVPANGVVRVPLLGVAGVPGGADAPTAGVAGVALNVTSVEPGGPGFLRVWDCASSEPDTSSVNFLLAGSIEPNAVIVPLTGTGEVCVRSLVETDVLVDVAGWFDTGVAIAGGRIADTRYGIGPMPG